MSRPISTTILTTWGLEITNYTEEGPASVTELWPDDTVENFQYVVGKPNVDEEVVTIEQGRLVAATAQFGRITNKLHANLKSYFKEDASVASIVIDASEAMNADIRYIRPKDILDYPSAGDEVIRVGCEPLIKVAVAINMSDGTSVVTELQEGTEIEKLTFVGKDLKVVGFPCTVGGFIFNKGKNPNQVDPVGIIVYDEDGVVTNVAFKAIRSFSDGSTKAASTEDVAAAIAEAIENGEAYTIKLTEDIEADGTTPLVFNGDATLNLNGQTLTGNATNNGGIRAENGTLTVKGGEIVCKTPYDSSHSSGSLVAGEDAEVIVEDITMDTVTDDPVNKGQFGIVTHANGKITVNGGNITTGWYCVCGNGTTTNADAVVTINGGKLTSVADFAIYQPYAGTLIINGGEIIGGAGAISANNGNIEINGGLLKTLGSGDTGNWSDGTGGQVCAAINLNGKYGPVNLTINDGTFISEGGADIIVAGTKNPVNIIIRGGKFSSKPNAEWIAEGYVCSEEADVDGFFVVSAV